MTPTKHMTPAIQLLAIVWNHGNKDSWDTINSSMRSALSLAIGSGLEFKADDFDHMKKAFRSNRWIGACSEWIYRDAILVKNRSCIKAFEEYTGRKPFFGNEVQASANHCQYLHLNSILRARERLATGFYMDIGSVRWHVSSFNDDGGTIRLCRYETVHREGKPVEIREMTRKQMLEMCPA